ncbi:OLC1v1033565C1 [Oldenlandia corymbosa var. corymbosa]|uniref:OLC1v1033565C1 n=1 Tax=Oldenlandia corymbosa var. corymbosa TaxID=529605 RepID=A0AAV1CNL6_OLDCO|nr:OLC1v1033565C1 [Oldenlandia corymbosa var. corymbosa]
MAGAGSSYPPAGYPVVANPVPQGGGGVGGGIVVVGPQFCAPYPVDLIISRKLMTLAEGSFGVTDVNGNLMFKVKGKFFSLRDRRVLLDAADQPLLSFQQKILTAHRRWKVFRGDSSDDKNQLFSVRKSSLFQFKTKLDVFLASNTKEDVCDFRIEGSWFERSCTIYAGESSTIIAQVFFLTTFEIHFFDCASTKVLSI